MKKVYQSTYTIKDGVKTGVNGDCWSACVASYLELGIEEVPRFVDHENPMQEYLDFMRLHGYEIFNIQTKELANDMVDSIIEGIGEAPFFVAGKSFKGDWSHMVIYKDGKLYHDPNDLGKGVQEIWEIELPILLNPKSQKD